jgi:hypothetical protein
MAGGESIKLDRLQRDAIAPQIDAFLASTADASARDAYTALRNAVEELEVPDEMAARLGAITEMAITSGRARAAHGPGAELALWSLFQKTPKGQAIAASVAALNRALGELEGQPLEHANAVARGPGAYALTLKTAECQLTIRFEPGGIRVESAEFG